MAYEHSEYHYKSETSDTVIVFIHGIQGSPLQFDFMIEALSGAYSIENLLLPGHGRTAGAFGRSSMAQWQQYLDERVGQLENAYANIILVGHSMGCLLSVQSAISHPQRIRGLFLTALPLHIHLTYAGIKNNLIVAFCKDDKNEIIAAGRRGNSVTVSYPYEYLMGAPRYIELLKKSKATRALLKELALPVVVVQSANDEIVSPKSLRHAENRPNIQTVTVRNAGHYYYPQEAQEQIANSLKAFIAAATAGS